MRILIVEDNRAQQTLIREMTKTGLKSPANFTTTARRATALEQLAETEFDVILLDLMLPDSEGLDTFETLQAHAPHVPIIVLSGVDDEELALQAVQAGAQDYLVKGQFTHHLLAHAIPYAIERKRITEALRASEEKFRTLAESSPVGILLWEAGELRYANPALARVLGYQTPADLLQVDVLSDHLTADDRAKLEQLLREESRTSHCTVQARRVDGETFTAQVYLAPLRERQRTTVIATLINVEPQRRAERRLKRRNAELTVLNSIATTVSQSLNLNEVLNNALLEVLKLEIFSPHRRGCIFLLDQENGVLRTAACSDPDKELCPKLPIPLGTCLCGQAAQRGEIVQGHAGPADTPHRRSTTPHVDVCIPLKTHERVVGVLALWLSPDEVLQARDIELLKAIGGQIAVGIENAELYERTKQRTAELSLLYRTGQTITSTLNLDELLTTILGEVKAMLSAEGAWILLNDSPNNDLVCAAAVGPGIERWLGERKPLNAGLAGWALEHWQPVICNNTQQDERFYARVDELITLTTRSLLVAPMRCHGKVIGVLEVVHSQAGAFGAHDLELLTALADSAAIAIENAQLYESEREQRKLVESSQAQLTQNARLAATGRLAASLAHELNNPLQAIHNSLEMILSFPFSKEEQLQYIEMADEEVTRMIGMVNRILDFSRRPREEMETLDVHSVLERVLDLAHKYLQHRHIALERHYADELPKVWGNATLLGQVFLNLIINGVEAMPNSGVLSVSTRRGANGCVNVQIKDTGTGIPEAVKQRLFEPFFTTKEQGTGLGLSISQSIIEQHEGKISFQSQVGEGTTFTVCLPVLDQEEKREEN
jgi:PAS domain S-box-containing protein